MKLQTDDYSCGAVSLMNAYYNKHHCYPKNMTIKRINNICETTEEYGTYRWCMRKNPLIKLEKSVYTIKKILQMKTFILLYSFSLPNGGVSTHYVFVEKDNDYKYTLYNYLYSDEETYVHRTMDKSTFIKKLLKKNSLRGEDDVDYPVAWEII